MERYKFKLTPDDGSHLGHASWSNDIDHEMDIPKNWGYVKAGWYTKDKLKEMKLSKDDALETRTVQVTPESLKTLPLFEDLVLDNGDVITALQLLADFSETREIRGDEYVIPGLTIEEYRFAANYTIEMEDMKPAQDLAEAKETAKLADRTELRGLINAIKNDADLKPYQKKLYKYLIQNSL